MREKQIEEMTKITCSMYCRDKEKKCVGVQECDMKCLQYQRCETLYNAGYRKQSEGEWEKFEGERFICSNCAKVFGLGSTATIYDVKRVWKYCPNRGAKMKGGEG